LEDIFLERLEVRAISSSRVAARWSSTLNTGTKVSWIQWSGFAGWGELWTALVTVGLDFLFTILL